MKLSRSIVFALVSVAAGVACAGGVVFAQETDSSVSSSVSLEPAMPAPADGTGGYSVPPSEGDYPRPTGEPYPYPGPMPASGGYEGQMPDGDPYRAEYERQYKQEFQRQYEQRAGQMPQRYQGAPSTGEGSRPQGQPFQGERQMMQKRPFMNEDNSQGRPFGDDELGGPEGGEYDEAAFEEKEREMKARQLAQMKRGFRGMESGIRQVQKTIDRLAKNGITVPAEDTALIQEVTSALQTLKSATDINETTEAALEVMKDKGPEIGEIGRRLGQLEQWPKALSQAEKQVKRINTALERAKKKKGVSEFGNVVSQVEAKVAEVRATYEELKALGAAGEFEDAMDVMQDFFEQTGEVAREVGMLEQLANISKMIRSGEKEIARFEKEVKRVGKKGADVSSVLSLIAEGRGKLAELKALGSRTDTEPDDFFDLMQALDEIRQQATDEFNAISGREDSQEGAVIRALHELRRN